MSTLSIRLPAEHAEPSTYITDSPIDFDNWITLSQEMDSELIRGVMVERMVAYDPHESMFAWLHTLLFAYVTNRKLGSVLGSRTAVKITANDGRLPDILFVRAENEQIIHDDGIHGAPDVVIEIVSKNDSPRYRMNLETDYRSIGVTEIVFIDPAKSRVKYIIKTDAGYETEHLTGGRLKLKSIPGFGIDVAWLFAADRPDSLTIATRLVKAARRQSLAPN